jgi:NAD(P)H-hydrate epimerase
MLQYSFGLTEEANAVNAAVETVIGAGHRTADIKTFIQKEDDFMGLIPARKPDSHKGTYGHVLVLAGSPGKTGAASMAGNAAMRAGAGLVTLGVPDSLRHIVEEKTKEVMTEPLPDVDGGYLGIDSWQKLAEMLKRKSVAVVGPGLSDRSETGELVLKLIEEADVPLVIDADGLNLVAKNKDVLKKAKRSHVLTPHPGEMSRLTGLSVKEIQENRISSASVFAKEFGVILVLKGATTVIAEPKGKTFINTTGNPGMAGGGMGDVLTGFISGLIAQGISPLNASRMAVFIHGAIGDFIAESRSKIGILASDIAEKIPEFLKQYIKKN